MNLDFREFSVWINKLYKFIYLVLKVIFILCLKNGNTFFFKDIIFAIATMTIPYQQNKMT